MFIYLFIIISLIIFTLLSVPRYLLSLLIFLIFIYIFNIVITTTSTIIITIFC